MEDKERGKASTVTVCNDEITIKGNPICPGIGIGSAHILIEDSSIARIPIERGHSIDIWSSAPLILVQISSYPFLIGVLAETWLLYLS